MELPEFLKRENVKPLSDKEKRFFELIDVYTNRFGDNLITEPSERTLDEWIELLEKCIDTNQDYWEFTHEEYDEDALY